MPTGAAMKQEAPPKLTIFPFSLGGFYRAKPGYGTRWLPGIETGYESHSLGMADIFGLR
jgi:hypothetical protein